MPFYMFKGRYNTDSLKSLVAHPEDREAEARKMIEALGGKLHHLFFCFGDQDYAVELARCFLEALEVFFQVVVALIFAQALLLRLKGARYRVRPEPPSAEVSR